MELYARQQFEALLGQSGEAFIDRIVQRCAGQDAALEALRRDRNAEGVWLDEFVDAVFADSCLDNAEGATFVLCALQRRRVEAVISGSAGDALVQLAKAVFAQLLYDKVLESMERASVYG